jgi:integrase
MIPPRDSVYYRDAVNLVAFLDKHGGLTEDALKQYHAHVVHDRGGKGWTAGTCAHKISAAKSCIRRIIMHSPNMDTATRFRIEEALKALKPPKVQARAVGREKVLTRGEERAVLAALDPGTAAIVRFMLGTGCRISEALGIMAKDVKTAGDHCEVRLQGKGNKERRVYWRGKAPSFTGNRTTITNRIRRASLKAIGRTVSAHCCRHTWATRMLAEGKDLTAVSKYMGHSSVEITSSTYVHNELAPEDVLAKGRRK